MNARAWATLVALLGLSVFVASAHADDDDPLTSALKQVVTGNLSAFNKEDVDATMSFVDTQSPDYEMTKNELPGLFKDYDLTSSLVSFTLIGHDDEFAVARVRQKTTGKTQSHFADNTVDSIMIFHQQNGGWKLWSEDVLGVELGH